MHCAVLGVVAFSGGGGGGGGGGSWATIAIDALLVGTALNMEMIIYDLIGELRGYRSSLLVILRSSKSTLSS